MAFQIKSNEPLSFSWIADLWSWLDEHLNFLFNKNKLFYVPTIVESYLK